MLCVTITMVYSFFSSLIRSSTARVRWVEGGARFVHEQHLRVHGHGACDAQTLLLAAGQADARIVQTILDLVPQVGATQGPLDQIIRVGLGVCGC